MKEQACRIRLRGICNERHHSRVRQNAQKRAVSRHMLARSLQGISTAQPAQSLVLRGTLAATCLSFAVSGVHCVEDELKCGCVHSTCYGDGMCAAAQSARCCHGCSCSSSCVEMCGEAGVAAALVSAQANAAEAMPDILVVASTADLACHVRRHRSALAISTRRSFGDAETRTKLRESAGKDSPLTCAK